MDNLLLEKFLNAFDNAILTDSPERKVEFLHRAKNIILELNEENENIFIGKPTLKAIEKSIRELES